MSTIDQESLAKNSTQALLEPNSKMADTSQIINSANSARKRENIKSFLTLLLIAVSCLTILLGIFFLPTWLGKHPDLAATWNSESALWIKILLFALLVPLALIANYAIIPILILLWGASKQISFWDWMDKESPPGELSQLEGLKLIIVFFCVFIGVPGLIFGVTQLHLETANSELPLTIIVIFGLYWASLRLSYVNHRAKRRLNALLDRLLESEDYDFKCLAETLEQKRRLKLENKYLGEEGNERVKVLGIK